MSNPKSGGRYIKADADSAPVFVEGTDRKPSKDEKAAAEKITKAAKPKK